MRATDGLSTGERCHAVVRPEKLVISTDADEPAPDGPAERRGQVESSVYLGTSTQIVVRLAGDVRMTVLVPNADEAERAAAARRRRAGSASAGRPSTSTWCAIDGSRTEEPAPALRHR